MQLPDDLLKILIGAQHGLPARGTSPDDVSQASRRNGPIVQTDPHFPFPIHVEDPHFTHRATCLSHHHEADGGSGGGQARQITDRPVMLRISRRRCSRSESTVAAPPPRSTSRPTQWRCTAAPCASPR